MAYVSVGKFFRAIISGRSLIHVLIAGLPGELRREVAYELLLVCWDVRGLSVAVLRLSDVDNIVGMGIFLRCVGYGLRVVLVW
jgi:hypothetical protein